MTSTSFRLYLTGDRRKYPWVFAAVFAGLWFAAAGMICIVTVNPDWRLVGGVLCIPFAAVATRYWLNAPCRVRTSEEGLIIEVLRATPLVSRTLHTLPWSDLYRYEYRGFYAHEYPFLNKNNNARNADFNYEFVVLYLYSGGIYHFQGREGDEFYYYLKAWFPDRQHYPY